MLRSRAGSTGGDTDLDCPPAIPSQESIRQLLAARIDTHRLAPGMIVATTESKRHVTTAYGVCDAASGRRIDDETVFEVGSVTKLFTALLLADAVGRREAQLDEPVAALLPPGTRVPSRNGRTITLRDLAAHRSGLPRRPTNMSSGDPRGPYADYSQERLYAFLADHALAHTPGDVQEYSNAGYGLLGYALVLRTGSRDYGELARRRILGPLGMSDTDVVVPERLRANVACAHDDNLDPVAAWDIGILAGAGALRSNASDLLRFLDALCDPGSPIAPMIGPVIAAWADGGMDLGAPHPDGGIAVSHWGSVGGCRSFVRCQPAWGRGVVVLSNAAVDAVVDLGLHVLDARFATHWHRTEASVDPLHLERLSGRYRAGPRRIYDVMLRDGRLHLHRHGHDALRIFPMSHWQFFARTVNAQVTFIADPDGRAGRLVLHQDGIDQIAERIGAPENADGL